MYAFMQSIRWFFVQRLFRAAVPLPVPLRSKTGFTGGDGI